MSAEDGAVGALLLVGGGGFDGSGHDARLGSKVPGSDERAEDEQG